MTRTEVHQGGVAYIAVDPDGEWARTSTPHLLVLTDYDNSDNLIGVTFAGPLARVAVNQGVPAAIEKALSEEILGKINGPAPDRDELSTIAQAVDRSLALA